MTIIMVRKLYILIENEIRKAKFGNEGIKKTKGVKGISLVLAYHPQVKNL